MIHMMRIVSLVNEGPGSTHTKVCAWCNKIIREGVGAVSHGICPRCAAREMDKYFGTKSPAPGQGAR